MYLRGQIYEFVDKDGSRNKKALIVSDNDRAESKTLSILTSKSYRDGISMQRVKMRKEPVYFNCNMITYCNADQLGDLIGAVDTKVMDQIDRKLIRAIGLEKYKSAYDLVKEIVEGNNK